MIAVFTPKQIRDRLDMDHWEAKLLAEVVCSTYWGGGCVDLRELDRLDRLDSKTFNLALDIMSHRSMPEYDNAEFYALACWCRSRHDLKQWVKERFEWNGQPV